MIEILEDYLQKIFMECEYEYKPRIIKSNRLDLCDYQCDDAFKLAKTYKQNPMIIGKNIVSRINEQIDFDNYFEEVSLVNGFINIKISNKLINKTLEKMYTSEKFNLPKPEKQELFFLDYGGPNIAKPLHVGHLRTAIIGESIKRIINFYGHKTISDVHLGDYGLQIGEVIYAVLKDKLDVNDITLDYLNKAYPMVSRLCKENEEILKECAKITKDLQDGNQEYNKLWKKIYEVSLEDIKRIYKYLDVSFDLWLGESDSYKYIDDVTKELESKNLLEESDGAKVVRVNLDDDKKEIPPLIYQKSNGAYLYGTTDIATIYERVNKYKPNHILYVTDARQALHFTQVFRTCNLWGITKDIDLIHIGYGTVNGSDGKPFKTRNGDAASLSSLLEQIKETFIETKEENKNMSEEDLDIITNSIVKFADLQNNFERDYIFDIKKFSEVVGKTGPYILYTYLRLNKVINSYSKDYKSFDENTYNDRNLRLKLLELPIVINNAFNSLMPSYIAEYVYDLCTVANTFYQSNYISTQEDEIIKEQWLKLLDLTNKIIKTLLDLLVIKIPSKM